MDRLAGGIVHRRSPISGAIPGTTRLPARRDGTDHVRPRSIRLDGLVRLCLNGNCERHGAYLAASAWVSGGQSKRSSRGLLHSHLPRNGLPLGETHVGYLVGMGRTNDIGADPAFPVYRLHGTG